MTVTQLLTMLSSITNEFKLMFKRPPPLSSSQSTTTTSKKTVKKVVKRCTILNKSYIVFSNLSLDSESLRRIESIRESYLGKEFYYSLRNGTRRFTAQQAKIDEGGLVYLLDPRGHWVRVNELKRSHPVEEWNPEVRQIDSALKCGNLSIIVVTPHGRKAVDLRKSLCNFLHQMNVPFSINTSQAFVNVGYSRVRFISGRPITDKLNGYPRESIVIDLDRHLNFYDVQRLEARGMRVYQ